MIKVLLIFILVLKEIRSANFKQLDLDNETGQKVFLNSFNTFQGESLFGVNQFSSYIEIYISMWFLPRINNLSNNFFQILAIKQNEDQILKIQLYPTQFTINFLVLNNPYTVVAQSTIQNDNWALLTVLLIADGTQIKSDFSIYNPTAPTPKVYQSSNGPILYNSQLNQQNLKLEIGNYSEMQKDGLLESLAFVSNLIIYWDQGIDKMNRGDFYSDDFTSQMTELVWHYDFFYTRANPNQVFNTAGQMNKFISGFDSNSNILSLKAGQYFKTDYVNPFENGGIIVSFHFRISSLPSTSFQFMKIVNSDIKISIDNQGAILFQGFVVNGPFISNWYQIVLVVKNALQNQVFFLISQNNQKFDGVYTTLSYSQLQFGDPSGTVDIDLNHIRYYKGTFVSSNQGNCFLQASQYQPTCLLCQNTYSINYKDNFSCSSQNTSQKFIDYNQNSIDCQKDMIYDQYGVCVCMKQFYKTSDNKCAKCPKYCDECYNSNQCIKKDPLRQSDGKCPNSYFDDGFLCIDVSQKLTIKKKINLIGYFSPTDTITFHNNLIQLPSQGPYSFFYCFTFQFQASTFAGKFSVISDQNNEIFSFYYEPTASLAVSLPQIKFMYLGTTIYNAFIEISEPIWISFWTDMSEVLLLFQSYSKFFYKQLALPSERLLINPLICVGHCNSGYLPSPAIRPFVFIQNMQNPQNDIKSLKTFLSSPVSRIAKFEVFSDSDQTKMYFNQLNQNINLKIQYINIPTVDLNYGFMFSTKSYAVVYNINIQYWISFYCTILPVTINSQTSLLKYNLDSTVAYFLVPQGQKILIRICYRLKCIDTKYAKLNLNESNSLFILMRNKSPFSQTISFIEFEIVCNYQREQIQFLNSYQPISISVLDLYIGFQKQESLDYLFYLNLINIDDGDELYYYDYTQQEPCFIFIQIYDMQCIYYKYNLIDLKYNEEIIKVTEQECLTQYAQEGYENYVNQQTRQCLQRCAQGYFQEKSSQKCIKCLPQCKTCQDSRDNCTSCQYSDQKIPLCDCLKQNFFLNDQKQCQKCSDKCQSCIQNQDLCLECSENRVNPPLCECDPFNFKENNNVCNQIDSSHLICSKFKYDKLTNQIICLKCKEGRTNPPQCDCLTNYKSNQDGTCSFCPSSFYFDSTSKDCKPCSLPCLSCKNSDSQCSSCIQGLQLKNSQCNCPQGSDFQREEENSQQFQCRQLMKLKLSVKLKNSSYQVIFTFDKNLKQIDFTKIKYESLIQIMLSEVKQSLYQFNNPRIIENKFILNLDVYDNIKASIGIALFLQTNAFVSSDSNYILSPDYLKNPLQFQVGPYIFQESIFNRGLQQIVDTIKNQGNENLMMLIKQINFIFYLLNTVQPSNLFILLNLKFPPNLYMFYQILGSFIYPDVVDYMSSNYKESFSLFGYQLNQTEVYLVDRFIQKRIGLSNSLIINAPIIILKYFILILLIFIISSLFIVLQYKFKNLLDKLQDINQIVKQRINAENEINLLMITYCSLSQFLIFQQENQFVRYGYYLSIIMLILIIYSFYKNLIEINYLTDSNTSIFSYQFTKRLKLKCIQNSFFGKNYFLIQLAKNFQNSPKVAGIINGVIVLFSAITTYLLKPYLNVLNRIVKIISEFCFSAIWFLHVYLALIEEQLDKYPVLDQNTIHNYLETGQIIIILLLIFNFLFLSEYVILIYSFMRKCCQKKQIEQNQLEKNDINSKISLNNNNKLIFKPPSSSHQKINLNENYQNKIQYQKKTDIIYKKQLNKNNIQF